MHNTTFNKNVLNRTQQTIAKQEVVYKLHQKLKACNRIIESPFTSIDATEHAIANKDFYLQILSVM
jgi:hypothetical protein